MRGGFRVGGVGQRRDRHQSMIAGAPLYCVTRRVGGGTGLVEALDLYPRSVVSISQSTYVSGVCGCSGIHIDIETYMIHTYIGVGR